VKGAVVTVVDDTTAAIGGEWEVYSGPAVRECTQEAGGDGAAYSYITTQAAAPGDPSAHIDAVEELWNDPGIAIERYRSGGDDPILGIRGSGGPTTTIDFLADERGYSVAAQSRCVGGDPVELRNRGE
jgi:hypothetical protein